MAQDFKPKNTGSDFRAKGTGTDFAPKRGGTDFKAKESGGLSSGYTDGTSGGYSGGTSGSGSGSALNKISPLTWIGICVVSMIIVGIISSNAGRQSAISQMSPSNSFSTGTAASSNTASEPEDTKGNMGAVSDNSEPATVSSKDYGEEEEAVVDEAVTSEQSQTVASKPVENYRTINIDRFAKQSKSVDAAQFGNFANTFYSPDQVDEYPFTAVYSGIYRFDISDVISGSLIKASLYGDLGDKLKGAYLRNGEGFTYDKIEAGRNYVIRLSYDSGDLPSYNLKVGIQKPVVDITGITELHDSIEFIDQENIYTFTVPVDGTYRFETSEMMSGTLISCRVYNHLNEKVKGSYLRNGEGMIVENLRADDTYVLKIGQDTGASSYILNIGMQKDTVDISGITVISDSIEYSGQVNNYTLKPSTSGSYTVGMAGMSSGTLIKISIYDHLDSKVKGAYLRNNEDFTVDLNSSETYRVKIDQDTGITDYTMRIIK